MKYAVASFKLAIYIAMLSGASAFTQTADDEATDETSAPVAYVYVQTTPGVMAFSAAANGQLTPIVGSPFLLSGQMEDISGKHLISVGTTELHTYPIESNGKIGSQISQTNTADYGGSECGGTSGQGSVLDHTGKYLYVQLSYGTLCAAFQTYQVESNGHLEFKGDVVESASDEFNNAVDSSAPTISSNDKFAYGVFLEDPDTGLNYCEPTWVNCPYISAFTKNSAGELEKNRSFTETDPVAPSGMRFIPSVFANVQADPSGHLAVLMVQVNGSGAHGEYQLASYTINPSTGGISSSNTHLDMPDVDWGPSFVDSAPMSMSPSGKLLANGGYGLRIFHFNGAAPATDYDSTLLPSVPIDKLTWDNHNHLYALSYDSAQLYVFTVTPTSITEAPGSPYSLPDNPYGTSGIVVIP